MNVCVCKAYPKAWRCTAFISHFPYPSFNPSIISTHSFMFSFLLKVASSTTFVLLWCGSLGVPVQTTSATPGL